MYWTIDTKGSQCEYIVEVWFLLLFCFSFSLLLKPVVCYSFTLVSHFYWNLLYSHNVQILTFDASHERTCLHYAAKGGHLQCLETILEAAKSPSVSQTWWVYDAKSWESFLFIQHMLYSLMLLSFNEDSLGGLAGSSMYGMGPEPRHCILQQVLANQLLFASF